MLFLGIIWGAFHGRLAQVTEGALSAAGEAVTLSLTMVGIVAFWNGILEIGSRAGLVEQLSGKMSPILKFLFPNLPTDCEAARQISVNFIANILGLGWAATPAGLKAMKELEKIEEIFQEFLEGRNENSKKIADSVELYEKELEDSGHEHFIPSADPGEYHRLQKPVSQCICGSCYRSMPCGNYGKYSGSGIFLQDHGSFQ